MSGCPDICRATEVWVGGGRKFGLGEARREEGASTALRGGGADFKMGCFATQASAHFDTRRTPRTSHVARCTPHTTHCAPHAAHHSPLVHHYRLRGPSFSPSDRTLRARFALHQKGTMALSSDTEVWHARPATVALPRANTLHVPIALTLQPPHRPRAVLCSPRCAATSRSSASGLPTARGG